MTPEFTYFQNNSASRLDRIYVSKLANDIQEVKTETISFSDHFCVSIHLNISSHIKVGRPLWKLNTSLLTKLLIREKFLILWCHIRDKKRFYHSVSSWWESLVKPQVKKFFIMQGREENNFKYGTLNYLELKLRKQYEIVNTSGDINKNIIDILKQRIDRLRDDMARGVKIRTRLQDAVTGETVSN